MLAIIGGTGLTALANLQITHRQVIRTPYGEPSGALTFGLLHGQEVVFLARHGYGHTIPPHEINYRANLWALSQQHVTRIVAVGSVGGIRADLVPGAIVVPDQIIDYTHARKQTFFEGGDRPVVHVDFTDPYDEPLRQKIIASAERVSVSLSAAGVYACTQGPRLETAAEVRRIARDGGDMIGMTGMPEAALARELEIPYACLAVVANAAAGTGNNLHHIDLQEAHTILDQAMGEVRRILEQIVLD